jgi:Tat protein translocase TatB subunit
MSGIGFSELLILFVIGLIVLGPERLPRVANQIGSWLGQARRMTRVMRRQLEEELDFDKPSPPRTPTPADQSSYSPAPEQPTIAGFDAVKVHARGDNEAAEEAPESDEEAPEAEDAGKPDADDEKPS